MGRFSAIVNEARCCLLLKLAVLSNALMTDRYSIVSCWSYHQVYRWCWSSFFL